MLFWTQILPSLQFSPNRLKTFLTCNFEFGIGYQEFIRPQSYHHAPNVLQIFMMLFFVFSDLQCIIACYVCFFEQCFESCFLIYSLIVLRHPPWLLVDGSYIVSLLQWCSRCWMTAWSLYPQSPPGVNIGIKLTLAWILAPSWSFDAVRSWVIFQEHYLHRNWYAMLKAKCIDQTNKSNCCKKFLSRVTAVCNIILKRYCKSLTFTYYNFYLFSYSNNSKKNK